MAPGRATNELRGLGDLAGLIVERVLSPVTETHAAVAGRAFGAFGQRAESIQRVHDSVSALGYGSIRAVTSLASATVGVTASAIAGARPYQPVTKTRRGSAAVSVFNGLWGDELHRRSNDLRIEMAFRDKTGDPIDPTRKALHEAFPHATSRIAVFIHGLAETERCWGERDTLGEMLTAAGYTELRVRYNSGLPIADNGENLARLLDQTHSAWPVTLEEIAVLGHSMGGLVARSAAHAGVDRPWTSALSHIVTIGTPHAGAPLEKATHLVAGALRLVPESRPIGLFLDSRSRGIKDLRHGTVLRANSSDSPDGVERTPSHTRFHFVAGTVTANPSHPLGVLIGDLLVRTASGTGRVAKRPVASDNTGIIGNLNHLSLLTDPVVHELVAGWLSGRIAPEKVND